MDQAPSTTSAADRMLVCGSLDEAVRSWGPVLEAVPTAVAIYSRDGTLVYRNGPAASVWPPKPTSCPPSVREALETARPIRDRNEIIERGAGSPVAVLCNVDPLRDPEGRLVGAICCGRDMTEREAVDARARHAQKTERVGRLTGEVAHDFNNLLTAVLGNLELLERRVAGDPGAIRQVHAAQRSALRGARLTEQLLAFSRRQPLRLKPVDENAAMVGRSDPMADCCCASAPATQGRG
jgi:two-component system, cell cycle sensor histidine kinase and response regulator CckA